MLMTMGPRRPVTSRAMIAFMISDVPPKTEFYR
jgi:hypothetical protein